MSGYQHVLNSNPAPVTTFIDSGTRADRNSWGPNWLKCPISIPTANSSWCTFADRVETNKLVIRGSGGTNPLINENKCFIPKPVISTLYSEPIQYVKSRFQAAVGMAAGWIVRVNWELNNGIGSNAIADAYLIGNGGTIVRMLPGSSTTLDATTWSLVAGDLVRITMEDNGSNVTIKGYKNGVLTLTAIDTNALRVTVGTCGLYGNSVGGANPTVNHCDYDLFETGKGLGV